ncbi:TPA: MFS transporter [Burkholderia cenocepacia]|nr:MFS transporter [Burkholderia cenocepacia]
MSDLVQPHFSAVAADKERRVFRRVIMRLLPVLIVAFVLNYIDRTNIGFAALTMNRDIGLSPTQFGFGAGILFFSYCLFEVPSNLALYRLGARRWLARIMITWGLLSVATIFVKGPTSFYILRLLLGIAEAGFVPGAMFFFATWFPVRYRSRILAWFQMAVPLASLISGPLSGAIFKLDTIGGLAGWQWIFICEGLPAFFIGIALLFVLADRPSEAKWLDAEEQQIVERAVSSEKRKNEVHRLGTAFRDPRVLVLAGIQFGFTLGSYAVAIWLPQILKEYQLTNSQVGWLSSLPYLCGCIATILWANYVDRTGARTVNLAITCCVATVGLFVSVATHTLAASMAGMCIALVGITSARGIFWSIPPRFLSGAGAAAGLAMINSIGTMGGFFGPVIMGWIRSVTGSFTAGLVLMGALISVSGLLALVVRHLMKHDSSDSHLQPGAGQ